MIAQAGTARALTGLAQDQPVRSFLFDGVIPSNKLASQDLPKTGGTSLLPLLIRRGTADRPFLRASDEPCFILRVLQARRTVWLLPADPSLQSIIKIGYVTLHADRK